jgi:hypothetical protein
MNAIGHIVTTFFDLLLAPFGSHHASALVGLSLLTGAAMAFVFKWTSRASAIRTAKQKIKAHILEMRIYQDDPVLILQGFGATLLANLRYVRTLLRPMLVLIVPLIVVFMQMDARFARRPLSEGTTTLLSVQLRDGTNPFDTPITLSTHDGLTADSRPVRVRETRSVGWRLRVVHPGTHAVSIGAGDHTYAFSVVAGERYRMIGHERNASSWIEPLLHPTMPSIPSGSPLARVAVAYPPAAYPLLLWEIHWIAVFIIYSFLAAIIVKSIIKFEI